MLMGSRAEWLVNLWVGMRVQLIYCAFGLLRLFSYWLRYSEYAVYHGCSQGSDDGSNDINPEILVNTRDHSRTYASCRVHWSSSNWPAEIYVITKFIISFASSRNEWNNYTEFNGEMVGKRVNYPEITTLNSTVIPITTPATSLLC